MLPFDHGDHDSHMPIIRYNNNSTNVSWSYLLCRFSIQNLVNSGAAWCIQYIIFTSSFLLFFFCLPGSFTGVYSSLQQIHQKFQHDQKAFILMFFIYTGYCPTRTFSYCLIVLIPYSICSCFSGLILNNFFIQGHTIYPYCFLNACLLRSATLNIYCMFLNFST